MIVSAVLLTLAFALLTSVGVAAEDGQTVVDGRHDVALNENTDTTGMRRLVINQELSEAAYAVGETFLGENRYNLAVGVTQAIEGEVYVDPDDFLRLYISPVLVDISTLTSDSSRRDRAIQGRWLESAKYPHVVFRPMEMVVGEETLEDGRVPIQVIGDLTIRSTTRPVTFSGLIEPQGSGIRAELSSEIRMTEYGFEPPSIFGFLQAENEAELSIKLVAQPVD